MKQVISGHEDKQIRFFDINSSKFNNILNFKIETYLSN